MFQKGLYGVGVVTQHVKWSPEMTSSHVSNGLSSSRFSSKRTPCECAWTISGERPRAWAPATHVDDLNGVLSSWLQPGPVRTIAGV